MQFYRSTFNNGQTYWDRSADAVAERRKQLVAAGWSPEITPVDVPTDPAGLLAWLNDNVKHTGA